MKLVLDNIDYLKNSIDIISELVTEATFWIRKDFVELVAMDPGVVSMVILKLMKTSFLQYDVESEEPITINLNYFKQILKRVKKDEKVLIEKTEDDKLRIDVSGSSLRTFKIPLLSLEEESRKVPELHFPASVQLPSDVFKMAIEDASVVADSVILNLSKNSFVIEGKGDLSSQKTELKDVTILLEDQSATYNASYSIEYLNRMIKASKISDNVVIQFDNEYPLKLEYAVVDTMALTFILAPRANAN